MSRLVRIAGTLFLASTVLVILVQLRLVRLKEDLEAIGAIQAGEEERMILIGMLLAGFMAAGGFVLIIIAIFKKRQDIGKLPPSDE